MSAESKAKQRLRAARALEHDYFLRTGRDDFDAPEVARAVRDLAGMKTASTEEMLAKAKQVLDENEDLTEEQKRERYAHIEEVLTR